MIKISAGWYVIREEEGQLYFVDLRFGQLGFKEDSKFMWQYKLILDKNGKVAAERLPPNFDSAGGTTSIFSGSARVLITSIF